MELRDYDSGSENYNSEDDGFDSDIEAMLYSQIHHDNSGYVHSETEIGLIAPEQQEICIETTTLIDENIKKKKKTTKKDEKSGKKKKKSTKRDENDVQRASSDRKKKKKKKQSEITVKTTKESIKKVKRSSSSDLKSEKLNGVEKTKRKKSKHVEKEDKETSKSVKRKKKQEENSSKKKKKRKTENGFTKPEGLKGDSLRAACHKAMISFYSNDFCVFPKNKKDKSNWDILNRDHYVLKRAVKGRFFNLCDTCRATGHDARNCPVAKSNQKCYLCGEGGHDSSECRNELCHNCWGSGHVNANCPTAKKLTKATCSRCRQTGHVGLQCSDLWRQFHSTIEPGEPNANTGRHEMKRMTAAYCFNCGLKGHFGHLCRRTRLGNPYPFLPYVTFIDREEEEEEEVVAYEDVHKELDHWKNVFNSTCIFGQRKGSMANKSSEDKKNLNKTTKSEKKKSYRSVKINGYSEMNKSQGGCNPTLKENNYRNRSRRTL